MEIGINSILESIDRAKNDIMLERVLWINEQENIIVTISIYPNKGLPKLKSYENIKLALENGEIKRNTNDPFLFFVNPKSKHLEKHKEKRDKAWSIIQELVEDEPAIYNPHLRWQLILDVAQRHQIQPKTVLKYLKCYWVIGKIVNALLPKYNNCGGMGVKRIAGQIKRGRPNLIRRSEPEKVGINLDQFHREKIDLGIKLFYNAKAKHPLTTAYQLTIEKLYHLGYEERNKVKIPILPPKHQVPSLDQFKDQFYKGTYLKDSVIAREGIRRYNLQHRPVLSSAYKIAFGPGSVYQIDATLVDCYLVHSFDRSRVIGRPVLYVCQDMFSRMITGFALALEGP